MNIHQILNEYDALFTHATPDEIHGFLAKHICMAQEESDFAALLSLLNEQIGYARDTDRKEVAFESISKLQSLLTTMDIQGTMAYGNSMLNIANCCRKFGHYEEALTAFLETESTYKSNLKETDYAFAGLYNNWSLLALAQHDNPKAIELIRRSIAIIDLYPQAVINQATSRINLAVVLNNLSKEEKNPSLHEEAYAVLETSISLFKKTDDQDYHYAGALSALADMKMEDQLYAEAAGHYDQAIRILKIYVGDNNTVQNLTRKKEIALSNINEIKKQV